MLQEPHPQCFQEPELQRRSSKSQHDAAAHHCVHCCRSRVRGTGGVGHQQWCVHTCLHGRQGCRLFNTTEGCSIQLPSAGIPPDRLAAELHTGSADGTRGTTTTTLLCTLTVELDQVCIYAQQHCHQRRVCEGGTSERGTVRTWLVCRWGDRGARRTQCSCSTPSTRAELPCPSATAPPALRQRACEHSSLALHPNTRTCAWAQRHAVAPVLHQRAQHADDHIGAVGRLSQRRLLGLSLARHLPHHHSVGRGGWAGGAGKLGCAVR